jgi:hypothetical protein
VARYFPYLDAIHDHIRGDQEWEKTTGRYRI